MTEDEKLKLALDSLERLMRMFQLERILYLIGSMASLALFLYAGFQLFSQDKFDSTYLNIVFGATGLSTVCSSRVSFFLTKSFRLIEDIIRKLTGIEQAPKEGE